MENLNFNELDESVEGSNAEEDETLTAAQVFARMEEIWLNEKFSPDLQPHKSDVVDCIVQQLNAMQQNLNRVKKSDLKTCIHRMETERIRYVLSDFYRIRLHKIEQFAAHLLDYHNKQTAAGQQSKLTDDELTFAKEYQSNIESHLKTVAARHMPCNLQALDAASMKPCPSLDTHVFLRVVKDVTAVVEEETDDAREEVVDLKAGDQHIMRYAPLATLLDSGDVVLI